MRPIDLAHGWWVISGTEQTVTTRSDGPAGNQAPGSPMDARRKTRRVQRAPIRRNGPLPNS